MTPEERAKAILANLNKGHSIPYGKWMENLFVETQNAAVSEALARPVLPDVAGAELTEAQYLDFRDAIKTERSVGVIRLMLADLLREYDLLRSVIQDEAGTSTREVRNSAFRSGIEWAKNRVLDVLYGYEETDSECMKTIREKLRLESDI